MNIAVYKTNVDSKEAAEPIISTIQHQIGECEVSFDLEDRDNVLRVESMNGPIDESALEDIFKRYGRRIEPLP